MRKVFQAELEEVHTRLVNLSEMVSDAIVKATGAFATSDVQLAESVISNDEKIDDVATDLDELCINLLAKQQPVARDLRVIVAGLRMSASIERMGDLAAHIAQLARYRFPEKVVPESLQQTFAELGKKDVEIASLLVKLIDEEDLNIAADIRETDEEIDVLHQSVFDAVLSQNWEGSPTDTVDVTLASRYHERFADHAKSIAQKVVYLATGDWTDNQAQASSQQ